MQFSTVMIGALANAAMIKAAVFTPVLTYYVGGYLEEFGCVTVTGASIGQGLLGCDRDLFTATNTAGDDYTLTSTDGPCGVVGGVFECGTAVVPDTFLLSGPVGYQIFTFNGAEWSAPDFESTVILSGSGGSWPLNMTYSS